LTEAASSEAKLPLEEATSSTLRPNTLVDALPLVPGVIRTPDGRVQIAGLDEEHGSLLINSVNVNDPATGNFGLSVPIDSVDILKVMQSPFLAQYGNFTAGIVSAETRRGGDKFNYSLNDPFPDFRIRSGHLVGVQDASPRLNLSGPIIDDHIHFLEGFQYLMNKAEVRTLPFPVDEIRSNAFNSFTQIDALLGAQNSITVTFHFALHRTHYSTQI
jgi:outer membrane receptor for ferrienterochelin and colicin